MNIQTKSIFRHAKRFISLFIFHALWTSGISTHMEVSKSLAHLNLPCELVIVQGSAITYCESTVLCTSLSYGMCWVHCVTLFRHFFPTVLSGVCVLWLFFFFFGQTKMAEIWVQWIVWESLFPFFCKNCSWNCHSTERSS